MLGRHRSDPHPAHPDFCSRRDSVDPPEQGIDSDMALGRRGHIAALIQESDHDQQHGKRQRTDQLFLDLEGHDHATIIA